MSTFTSALRAIFALSIAVAGVQAIGALLGGPAEASCKGQGCASGHRSAPSWTSRGPSTSSGQPSARYKAHPYQYNPNAMSVSPRGPLKTSHPVQLNPHAIPVSPNGPNIQANVPGINIAPRGPTPTAATGVPGPSVTDARGPSNVARPAEYNPASAAMPPVRSPDTVPSSGTLTAVRACVTQQGSCAMPERPLATPCQCRDQQGRTYDGIVK
jgi:hypothetical protein